ncbi:protein FAM76A [Echinococcus multilocularis]|uniref:Protein FAM76A n=1 Tax=Echinococcus multilocularis TaxID=6211 RepID=A0A087W012_ECHMU|nr:protein FAM76A [Echinococcus multilocularis]
MEQPLFSCTRCLKNFPSSQMSRSGTICKACNPHHSSFKQCEYCRSDFKQSISGAICPRCCSLKSRYGDPKSCTICQLPMAFGSALVCQRCLHYRTKFGDPRQCEKCLHMCAFYKDEASRSKVDGQVLCWVCTYNYKMSKSKERSEKHQSKRSSFNDSYLSKSHDSSNSGAIKRQRTEEYTSRHSSNRPGNAANYNMDSAYNEHLLTIGQLQDDIKALKRQLAQKDAELLAKDKMIAGLKSDLDDYESQQRERAFKTQHIANEEIERLKETIRTLKREKAELSASRFTSKKRRIVAHTGSPLTLSPIRVPPKPAKLTTSVSTPNAVFHHSGGGSAAAKEAGDNTASPTPPHSPDTSSGAAVDLPSTSGTPPTLLTTTTGEEKAGAGYGSSAPSSAHSSVPPSPGSLPTNGPGKRVLTETGELEFAIRRDLGRGNSSDSSDEEATAAVVD